MASDNETVEQVCESLRCLAKGNNICSKDIGTPSAVRRLHKKEADRVNELSDRILAAHRREMAAKDAEVNRLRAIVVGLVDALVSAEATCADCDKTCDGCLNFNRTWIPNARNRIAEAKKVLAIYNG